jgi:predicted trehalose synthase
MNADELLYGSLEFLARAHLDRQPWFQITSGGAAPHEITLVSERQLTEAPVPMAHLVLTCRSRNYSSFVGWRPPAEVSEILHGRESAIFGSATRRDGSVLVYDALADDALAIELLRHATNGVVNAKRVRQLSSLASHASLVYDERFLMKCYRVLEEGTRPEIEVLRGLDALGFNAILAPIAFWESEGSDLALVREFLPSALEGRLLALTSLRDLLARVSVSDPRATFSPDEASQDPDAVAASAGGDLASEMRRLGATAASLHLAMAKAFETRPLVGDELLGSIESALGTRLDGINAEVVRGLAGAPAGVEIRIHGDFHLRRVMRADVGWIVSGFGDDPLNIDPVSFTSVLAQRGSPVEDLADMWFSIETNARDAVVQRPASERPLASLLAAAWVRRNQLAFLEGYAATPGVESLVPVALLRPVVAELNRARIADYEATLVAV